MITDEQVEAACRAVSQYIVDRCPSADRWPDDFDSDELIEQRRAMRAALEAAEAAAWRPIREAPNKGLFLALPLPVEVYRWHDGRVCNPVNGRVFPASGWRPLPAPPKGDAE